MLLSVLSVVAIAGALGIAAYAWHIVQTERRRSDARVAALAAAIEEEVESPGHDGDHDTPMFEREPRAGLQGRPLLKVGVGFVMAVGVIVLIAMSNDRHRAVETESVVTDAAATSHSLELVSMRHTRTGDSLTVTGLVRNRGASADGSITAVVFVFDRDGGFVASGRAPLELAAIADGDESPFQVTIADVKDVGRYRVSFRTAAGVVPHVDRRAPLQASSVK